MTVTTERTYRSSLNSKLISRFLKAMSSPSADAVARCQTIFAHAWMVRTFVKHSPEVEDFPELMEIARTVFDVSRALETRVDDPAGYFQMLRKKIGKLRKAADQFRHDAPLASAHTNFRQAVISIDASVRDLESTLQSLAPTGEQGCNGSESEN